MSLYAGLDCSTQSLTAVVIDPALGRVVFRDAVVFDQPFIGHEDPSVVHADPRTWRAALVEILGRLAAGVEASRLGAMAGAAQQHGTVYCGGAPDILTRATAPIWMDTSTARECDEIESALGGALTVARLTGSRAFPRFAGPQIRKFWRDDVAAYERTRRIHLVSSYMASLLSGGHAPLDHADASGMTLMDLRSREWSDAALDATAPNLREKLPPLVASSALIGTLDETWQRFGLPPARLAAWTGDNPASLVGTGLHREGQVTISLGTSDTIFGPMEEPRISEAGEGHVFAAPNGAYMGITVFRNGSLARDRLRRELGMTWEDFSDALRRTPAGSGGAVMLPWFEPEITPQVAAGAVTTGMQGATPETRVRALIEGQILSMHRHSRWMGVIPSVVHATGGASANREILQVIADVFGVPVRTFEVNDSAALGAAVRAWQAHTGIAWPEAIEAIIDPLGGETLTPAAANDAAYKTAAARHAQLEADHLAGLSRVAEGRP